MAARRGKLVLGDGEQEDVPELAVVEVPVRAEAPEESMVFRGTAVPSHTKSPAAVPAASGTVTSTSAGSHSKATAYTTGTI